MSERVQIVVPGDNPIQIAGSPHLQRLEPYGDVTLFEDTPQSADEKIARAKGSQIIINSRGVVTWREEMRRLPELKMIATCSIGTDMIDLALAKELGIVVSNQPGRTAPGVATFQGVGITSFATVNHEPLHLVADVWCHVGGDGTGATHGLAGLHQGGGLRPLPGSNQVQRAQLVLLTPPTPVVFVPIPVQYFGLGRHACECHVSLR